MIAVNVNYPASVSLAMSTTTESEEEAATLSIESSPLVLNVGTTFLVGQISFPPTQIRAEDRRGRKDGGETEKFRATQTAGSSPRDDRPDVL